MFIDLTCPAELFRTVLPTEEIPAAALTLFNLSDRVIASVEVMLRLLDRNGAETEKLSYRSCAERPAPFHLPDDGSLCRDRCIRGRGEH